MSKVLEFPGSRAAAASDRADALGFYTPAEAARLARVPLHRLTAWKRESILFPTLHVEDADGMHADGYTFDAVVYLRLLRVLRERNYAGWISLDFNYVDMTPGVTIEQDMAAHREYLVETLHASLKR